MVKLWTVKTNECIATYDQHESQVKNLFSSTIWISDFLCMLIFPHFYLDSRWCSCVWKINFSKTWPCPQSAFHPIKIQGLENMITSYYYWFVSPPSLSLPLPSKNLASHALSFFSSDSWNDDPVLLLNRNRGHEITSCLTANLSL